MCTFTPAGLSLPLESSHIKSYLMSFKSRRKILRICVKIFWYSVGKFKWYIWDTWKCPKGLSFFNILGVTDILSFYGFLPKTTFEKYKEKNDFYGRVHFFQPNQKFIRNFLNFLMKIVKKWGIGYGILLKAFVRPVGVTFTRFR